MHPAFSVIFFTTASGAGYGILAILAVLAAAGIVPLDRTLGMVGLGSAFVLVSAGLASSSFHLGHPERAWRAFSQWRSSWLSREGCLSVITYGPWALLAYLWFMDGQAHGLFVLAALVSAILAAVTVYCTAMIYRSLKTVHQWCNRWTAPVYLALGLASGAVWTAVILALTVGVGRGYLIFALLAVLAAWRIKRTYWAFIDTTRHPATPQSATGLTGGTVRLLEGPHTEENYLQREMGFQIARKHAAKLRRIANALAFAVPALLLILAYAVPGSTLATVSCGLALLAISVGLLVERWLFFAEARHVVTLYYGAQAA